MTEKPRVRPWDTNNPSLRNIFCAALQGICANPAFFGGEYQGSPNAAIEFADRVVLAAITPKKEGT